MEVWDMLQEMVDDGAQVMNFNAAVYGLNAIKKAARRFGSQFYVLIEQYGQSTEVRLIPKTCCKSPVAYVGEFCNEVLDQELRERVAAEMAGIRYLLLAQAHLA
jgi:His-Xaa-Ser system protein HxsD